MVRLLLFLSLFLILQPAIAENGRVDNAIFHPQFKTLQVKVNGNDQLPPVIMAGSDDVIEISFDELASERRFMRYELLHCNALWRQDKLLPPEYVSGFNEGVIEDYRMSEATTVQYIHYTLTIPNPDMSIKLSGNYLLRVYDEALPGETLLQVRFSIAEPLMAVSASVTSRTDIDHNDSHQQLSLAVDSKGISMNNVMNDIIVTVEQNGRVDNSVAITHPSRIAGSVAYWEHVPQLIFPAGNEYRRMEVISTTYPGMGVESVEYADPYYHFVLKPDSPRTESSYIYDQTQHGRFRIREYNSDDSDVEADYVLTHFALDMDEIPGKDLFIDGDLTLRRFGPESLMVYNRATGQYEASLLLKQGAYNYEYLAVDRGSQSGSASIVEGDKYQTINEYLIKVYYREPGSRYDRLVAVTSVLSGR